MVPNIFGAPGWYLKQSILLSEYRGDARAPGGRAVALTRASKDPTPRAIKNK